MTDARKASPAPPRALLLDLDGTLLDSAPDIHAALDRLMASRGLRGFAAPEVHRMIGDGVRVLVSRAMAARGREATDEDAADYLADYEANATHATFPFPGVEEALSAIRDAGGWRMAVCTNKPERPAREILEATGLAGFFDAVAGGDTYPVRKPDPRHLTLTLDRLGLPPEGAVMVGDHANDVRSARAAGLAPVFAAWGYGAPEMAEGAVAVARAPADLPALLAALPATSGGHGAA